MFVEMLTLRRLLSECQTQATVIQQAPRELRSLGASWVIGSSCGSSISGGREVIKTDNCGTREGKETGREFW